MAVLLASRVIGIPLVAGLAFEVIKLLGKHRRKRWARVLMWPGMQLQKLTTREPALDQLAVAIAALEAVLAVDNVEEASEEDKVGMEVVAVASAAIVIEQLVHQIESRFAELSQQMSDPEVIADRERYAEVGRSYRQLERANRLAEEWRHAADDAAGARELLSEDGDDSELRELLASSERRLGELEEEIRLAMVEPDPNDDKNVIVEVRAGTGGEEAGLFAADLYRMLTRYAEGRGFKTEPLSRRDGDYTFAIKGNGAYSRLQVRGRHTPRAARARDGVAGPDPHLDRHRRGAAGGGGRGGADRPRRPPGGRVPLVGARRPVGEHHRLRRSHHPQAHRAGGGDAGREVPAAEPRQGDARAARAAVRAGAGRAAGGARRRPRAHRSARASAPRRSAPTTSRRTA